MEALVLGTFRADFAVDSDGNAPIKLDSIDKITLMVGDGGRAETW
jgi:hypothetical protein